ncbi:MAG: GntR family transcriptional regulator [Actinobacteria bacterium]|nr:GntR family transcriptional regulator [Actinomycetota bacterium]
MRYVEVAEVLRARIAAGHVGALPSEAELGDEFGVSRVTVRRALETLRDQGLVTSRRGAGWFVAVDPVRQPLGRVTTVESALEAAGATATRRVLEFTFEAAPARVAKVLGLPADGEVLRVTRLNLADGEPFAIVTVWIAASLGAEFSRSDVEGATFYELLPRLGVEPGRVVQTITAAAADRSEARRLGVPSGSPLLAARRITYDRAGHAVIVAEHRYAAHRTAFEVEFPFTQTTGARHD